VVQQFNLRLPSDQSPGVARSVIIIQKEADSPPVLSGAGATLELPGTASEDAVAAQGRIVEEELAQLKRICEGG
jgi:hypothetical protein